MAFFTTVGGMKDAGYTMQERSFILLMRIWAVLFLGAGILFAAIPEVLLNYLNDIGRTFVGWESPPIDAGGRFWLVLAVAFLICLSYVCWLAQSHPVRHAEQVRIVILGKFLTAAGFTLMLFLGERQFYYLVGAVVDGTIFLLTWHIFSRSQRSRS